MNGPIEHQGNCPVCLRSAVCVSVELSHWGTCPNCRVRWPIGYNLFSLDPSLSEWEDPRRNGENHGILSGYERVEAALVLESDPDGRAA
jgi:hypothetical protein